MLKILAGTDRPYRRTPELQLPPPDNLPLPPQFLDVRGAQEFTRVAEILKNSRILAAEDFGILTAYAALWSSIVRNLENGVEVKPSMFTAFRQYSGELGLSPASRAKLPPPPEPKRPNPFEEMEERRRAYYRDKHGA